MRGRGRRPWKRATKALMGQSWISDFHLRNCRKYSSGVSAARSGCTCWRSSEEWIPSGLYGRCWLRMGSSEVEEAGTGSRGQGLGCWGTVLVSYPFNQNHDYHRGHVIGGVEPSGTPNSTFRFRSAWAMWAVWNDSALPSLLALLEFYSRRDVSHWLCSCSPLAGVAGAASFPLRLQFHWESSPAAVGLSSSSPGLKNASPLWPGLGCFSVSCFLNPVCSWGKSSFSSSVQSALWMRHPFLSMTWKCLLPGGRLSWPLERVWVCM